jgi:regulation of enolase protein 1 (concanavalin A-like superfamily)
MKSVSSFIHNNYMKNYYEDITQMNKNNDEHWLKCGINLCQNSICFYRASGEQRNKMNQ